MLAMVPLAPGLCVGAVVAAADVCCVVAGADVVAGAGGVDGVDFEEHPAVITARMPAKIRAIEYLVWILTPNLRLYETILAMNC